ncbi:hypothetical protein OEZ86_004368 [Tetradesmus obliquus]|nr:hypothetical protein OEZ86_004368 [Tetradesmus obliquus]
MNWTRVSPDSHLRGGTPLHPASTKATSSPSSSTSSSSSSSSSSTKLTTDWEARRKQRVVNDLVEASKRLGPQFSREAIAAGVAQLEALLPGLQIDVEAMKASEWARLALDTEAAATRLVVLKLHYPRADLTRIMQRTPQLLLQDVALLEDNAKQVKQLLVSARDADALVTALPSLMEPRNLISVLVTVQKWYFNKRDPVEVIESDPELILRAQACGVPFEPVYIDAATGAWSAPGFNYLEKRAGWQKWLDEKHKKKDYMGLDGSDNKITAATAAAAKTTQQPQEKGQGQQEGSAEQAVQQQQ